MLFLNVSQVAMNNILTRVRVFVCSSLIIVALISCQSLTIEPNRYPLVRQHHVQEALNWLLSFQEAIRSDNRNWVEYFAEGLRSRVANHLDDYKKEFLKMDIVSAYFVNDNKLCVFYIDRSVDDGCLQKGFLNVVYSNGHILLNER